MVPFAVCHPMKVFVNQIVLLTVYSWALIQYEDVILPV